MLYISAMVTTKQKTYSRYTKDKEDGIKTYHCRKSSSHKGKVTRREERNKGIIKQPENNEWNVSSKSMPINNFFQVWMGKILQSKDIEFWWIDFFFFLGPHPWHMEVPRLEIELELYLPAYTTATIEPSCVCDLHHNSWQCQILNPLSEARDQTYVLKDTSHDRNSLAENLALKLLFEF